jgi:hypothetical protein
MPKTVTSGPSHRPEQLSLGIDKAGLADRLGVAPKDVERLFSIHHRTRFDQLEAALAVLRRRLVVSVEPA